MFRLTDYYTSEGFFTSHGKRVANQFYANIA